MTEDDIKFKLYSDDKLAILTEQQQKNYKEVKQKIRNAIERGQLSVDPDSPSSYEGSITKLQNKSKVFKAKQVKKENITKQYSVPYSSPVDHKAIADVEQLILENVKAKQTPHPGLFEKEDPDVGRGIGYLLNYKPQIKKIL